MGEQFQNWIENTIETSLGQKLDTKVKQYCQETFNTFQQNLNANIDEIFKNKTKTFEEKIKDKLKNEKEEFSKQSIVEFDQNCLAFEQTLTLKLEEMIETKSQELSVKFEAQIIKELEQVMGVVQQILNNGLDLDKNIEKELNTKFQEYLQGHKHELDEVLEQEINKKIQDSLTTKEQFLNNILEKKVNVCLKQILEAKNHQMNLKLEKQVNKTIKEILDNKTKLLELTSDDNNFEGTQSNINLHYEQQEKNNEVMQKAVNNTEYEKHFENLDSRIKTLEEELKQKKYDNKEYENSVEDLQNKVKQLEGKLRNLDKQNNSRGKYTNWEARHDCLRKYSFVSTVDFLNMLNTIENFDFRSNIQKAEIIRIFNSMEIHRVNPTKRFPVEGTFIDLNSYEVIQYIKEFYNRIDTIHFDACGAINYTIKTMKLGIETPEHKEVQLVVGPTGRRVLGFPKTDVVKFETGNRLLWSDS